ncbi:MAG: DUF2231 domain-containing protein [Aestuariivirga sp.]
MIPVQHIHPMLVHFPIVIIFALAAFDMLATMRGQSVTGRTTAGNISTSLAAFAAVFAGATYFFGGLALDVAESTGFHSNVAEIHEGLGEMVAIATSVYAVLRVGLWLRDVRISSMASFVFPATAVAGSVLVAVTAYYGGQLVYDLGVNVAKVAMN